MVNNYHHHANVFWMLSVFVVLEPRQESLLVADTSALCACQSVVLVFGIARTERYIDWQGTSATMRVSGCGQRLTETARMRQAWIVLQQIVADVSVRRQQFKYFDWNLRMRL